MTGESIDEPSAFLTYLGLPSLREDEIRIGAAVRLSVGRGARRLELIVRADVGVWAGAGQAR